MVRSDSRAERERALRSELNLRFDSGPPTSLGVRNRWVCAGGERRRSWNAYAPAWIRDLDERLIDVDRTVAHFIAASTRVSSACTSTCSDASATLGDDGDETNVLGQVRSTPPRLRRQASRT